METDIISNNFFEREVPKIGCFNAQTEVHQAIVLQNLNPRQKKICILDQELGRIEGTVSPIAKLERIAPGMVINYCIRMWKTSYVFYDIEIIDEPMYYAHTDILFIHHVLEICFYFLPLNDSSEQIFHLVKLLYEESSLFQDAITKKIFLCKFFTLIGIYPDNAAMYGAEFFSLISGAINSNFEADNHALNRKLRSWLLGCIATHPQSSAIKTIHFLHSLD